MNCKFYFARDTYLVNYWMWLSRNFMQNVMANELNKLSKQTLGSQFMAGSVYFNKRFTFLSRTILPKKFFLILKYFIHTVKQTPIRFCSFSIQNEWNQARNAQLPFVQFHSIEEQTKKKIYIYLYIYQFISFKQNNFSFKEMQENFAFI